MRSPLLTLKRARRLRREMTKPEIILWSLLREDSLKGLRFRRQHPIGPYILDFYCTPLKLCVEIDGLVHATPEAERHDERRTSWLEAQGIHVVRFAASDILNPDTLPSVIHLIESLAAPTTASGGPLPRKRGRIPDCDVRALAILPRATGEGDQRSWWWGRQSALSPPPNIHPNHKRVVLRRGDCAVTIGRVRNALVLSWAEST